MSLETARAYFSTIAEGLSYKKHYDGFAINNVPKSSLNKSYHVEAFVFNGISHNQTDLRMEATCVVRLFFKGGRDVDSTISDATIAGDAYLNAALSSENRLTQTKIKNVILSTMTIEPYAESNDNYVVCRMDFTALYTLGIC
jgi:hypothetical protein